MKASARVSGWAIIWLFIILAGCDFFRWQEIHIRILADERDSSQLNEEVRRVLLSEGYEEWKGKRLYEDQKNNVRVFNIRLKKDEFVGVDLSESEAGRPVTLVYREHQARGITIHAESPSFTEAAEKALQRLLRRLRETFGEKRVIVEK